MNTFQGTTPSGVSFTARGINGKVQGLVSDMTDTIGGMNKVFAYLLLSYGNIQVSETKESLEFVKQIPVVDKRYILGAIKVHSEEMPEQISYFFRYESIAEGTKGTELSKEILVDVNGKFFDSVAPKLLEADKLEGLDLLKPADYDKAATSLSQYNADTSNLSEPCFYKLGDTEFRFVRMNGQSEAILLSSDKRNTNTLLMCRKLAWKRPQDVTFVAVQMHDLEEMSAKNLDRLRATIRLAEGDANTTIRFEHPEAILLPPAERKVVVDLTTDLSFFFPAGRI